MQKFSSRFMRNVNLCGLGIALSLFVGCQIIPEAKVDPTRQYVLTGPASTDLAATKLAGKYQIGIRAIELPGYLRNHRDIAVRAGANEVSFQEFSRWAEPLESGIDRVLKQRLLSMDSISGVTNYPFATDVKRDYDLVIHVLNCEGVTSNGRHGIARFVATYDIIAAGAGGQVVVRRTFAAPELAWNENDFGALASLLSEDVARLSEDIAANLPK
jgi:hypothetical protein